METETKGESKDDPISDGTSLLVNQSGTGVQKRQKKSTAPVLQRIRPISKRKKFKKSLGPDFLEPAELGMQYLRDTYEPKCDICSLTMFSSSTSLNVFEELLHCNNCDAKAHPSCVNVNENEEVAHKTQWQCHNCKLCSVCRKTDTNEYVIICLTCSKGFHVKCHSTPIINRPKGNWYCHSCCTKGSTHSSHHTNGVDKKPLMYASDDSSQSEDNESSLSTRDEKNFKLMVENDSNNCEAIEKEKSISGDSSGSIKDEQNNRESNEDIEDNHNDSVSENMEITNGIHSIKENIDEEANEMDIDFKANVQSGDSNQSLITSVSPQKWSVEEVESFIRDAGFPSESLIFKEQEIDGRSLLLLRRMDVLTGLSLKLGPALKIYNHISRLQGRDPTQQTTNNSNNC
ncbi:unnamed protein product [Oppiella nova]|uniref:PHD-type domain-containing protein n=1 Tax=Oppiella nova TaxID=334625 RepID=A0A7R9L846_9ACAR|nr:unnamed protein product [Oppiella nova]CAG2158716.1 unnamed protein product [Oppiella nova]